MKVKELAAIAAIAAAVIFEGMEKSVAVKAYKACRDVKRAVKPFEDERAEASKTFKPQGFDDLNEKVQTRQPLKPEEFAEYSRMLKEYDDKVSAAIKESGEADAELNFEKLTEEEFFSLMTANPKMNAGQLCELETVIVKGN